MSCSALNVLIILSCCILFDLTFTLNLVLLQSGREDIQYWIDTQSSRIIIMVEHATINQIVDLIGKNRVHPSTIPRASAGRRASSPPIMPRKFVLFNVSGQMFLVTQSLLDRYPESKLADPQQLEKYRCEELDAYYFDRDPALFNAVLNIFRYNVLSLPPGCTEFMLNEELAFWKITSKQLAADVDECNACIEADFVWLESRIPPPKETASSLARFRYQLWCFCTDPIGPHTRYRKLAITFALCHIFLTIFFMIVFGLSTKPVYREMISHASSVVVDNSSLSEPPSCDGDLKIMCFVESQPILWIRTSLYILTALFIADTMFRLLICPDLRIYLKSIINWIDIISTLCLIALIGVLVEANKVVHPNETLALIEIVLQGVQVLRIFKILQVSRLLLLILHITYMYKCDTCRLLSAVLC